MAEGANQRPEWAGHQLYQDAIARFEAEDWEEAASLLSRLAREYPGDPELEQILTGVRLKASLDQEQGPKGRPGVRTLWRRSLYGLAVFAIVVLLATLAHTVYTRWLVPAWGVRDQLIQVRELHELARGYMAAGEYDKASSLYEEILDKAPEDEAARSGLQRAQQLKSLAEEYDRALSLTREERWWEALWAWRMIQAQDPNFRDADYWLDFVQRQDSLGQLFEEAEMSYAAGDWAGTIETLKRLRSQSVNYREEEVESLLAESLLTLAEQRLWESDDPETVREEVLELFDQAVQVRPRDQFLISQQQVAQEFLDSYARLQPDCEEQLETVRAVYDPQADSSPDQRFLLLYQANVSCGDQRVAARDFQGARPCFVAAAEMPVDDVSGAGDKYVALIPMLTPTATATPRPPTPIPTRRPATPTPTYTATRSPWRYSQLGAPTYRDNDKNIAGCDWLGVGGQVLDTGGAGVSGVKVRVWSGGYTFPLATSGDSRWTPLYGPGGWEVNLYNSPRAGSWNCQLVDENGAALSPVVIFETYAGDCSRNLVLINFKQNY
jgi:tetratricopeptide (TPR) repeat protein